jgi:hypothetical protein
MAQRSKHQESIIRRYYEHHDEIMLQRLGDLVTDLFLAEGKARTRLWKRAEAALQKLKIPQQQIAHIIGSDNPTLLVNLLKELLEKK